MSASIYWEPAAKEAASLPVSSKETFLTSLQNAGLGDPRVGGITLGENDLPILKGMYAVYGGVNVNNPYWHVIEAIEKHREIRIWAQY